MNVDVYEGTVYLSGFVERPIEKSDAEIAARRTEGVKQVVNDHRGPWRRQTRRAAASGGVTAAADSGPAGDPGRDPGGAGAGRGGPDHAFDKDGRVVATIYTRVGAGPGRVRYPERCPPTDA